MNIKFELSLLNSIILQLCMETYYIQIHVTKCKYVKNIKDWSKIKEQIITTVFLRWYDEDFVHSNRVVKYPDILIKVGGQSRNKQCLSL